MNQAICSHYTCKKKTNNLKCLKEEKQIKRPSQIITGRETADLNSFLINTSSVLKKVRHQKKISVTDKDYMLQNSQMDGDNLGMHH